MDFKDYYAALGVAPDADEQTIKQAYRKLARQYHPDLNPGDTQAEERFKAVNEAYQVLSDQEKRRKYDELREQYQRWEQRGGGGNFNWGTWQAQPGGYGAAQGISPEDLEDLFGEEGFSDFFSSIFGQASQAREPRPRRGRDREVMAEVTLEEVLRGATRTVQVGERRIEARIPPGVRTGSRVRLAGQGSPGPGGGPPGDLYLVIEVLPHPHFQRDGNDLMTEAPVDMYTAALGGEVRVATLEGSLRLKIPPRTQADRTFRLRGQGLPRLDRPDERGDLYVQVKLVLPEPLSDDELAELRKLAQARGAQ